MYCDASILPHWRTDLTCEIAQLFEALSEALNSQVRLVTAEKKEMVDEAKNIITTIRQMEASLDDTKHRREKDEDDFAITYPLNRCLQTLKEKHIQISRLHKERFEQVRSMLCHTTSRAVVPLMSRLLTFHRAC